MQKYVLGIDIGGTKTDYLLTTTEGETVDFLNVVTKINSRIEGKVVANIEPVLREMRGHGSRLLKRNGLTFENVEAVGIGAVGVTEQNVQSVTKASQKVFKVKRVVWLADVEIGRYISWYTTPMVTAFCGTGCVAQGYEFKDNLLYRAVVGGLGDLTGDQASGTYLSRQAVVCMYNHYYRNGKDSVMFPQLLQVLDTKRENLTEFLKSSKQDRIMEKSSQILRIADEAAMAGDVVALSLFIAAGMNMGQSVASCTRLLLFEGYGTPEKPIVITLFGSVWHKMCNTAMINAFTKMVTDLTGKSCNIIKTELPPVVGAAIMACEQLNPADAAVVREYALKVIKTVSVKQTESELAELPDKNMNDTDLLRYFLTVYKSRPEAAEKLAVTEKITGILEKYPITQGASPLLALTFLPAVSSVINNDYPKALEQFLGGSQHASVQATELEPYLNLATNIAAAAESNEHYVHFSKIRIRHLINQNRTAEAQKELDEFLALLPNDEELLELSGKLNEK